MKSRPFHAVALAAGLALALGILPGAGGCADTSAPPEAPVPDPLAVGESRTVELRSLRFEVTRFPQTLTLEDLRALPAETLDRLWLLDLDLAGGSVTPRLLDNALIALRTMDPDALDPAARNLQRLLTMTPDTADLRGTRLEALLSLAPLVGLSPARVLADLLGIDVEDPFLPDDVIADTLVSNLVATHPATRERLGPVTAANPEGRYPVRPGTLPITLGDAVNGFVPLGKRFGPSTAAGQWHPGIVAGEVEAEVFTDAFRMTVRANANALPFRGVELDLGAPASVGSIASQIERLFDFDDPEWLTIEGLVPGEPVIRRMSLRVLEHDGFVPGGTQPEPSPFGNSPGWSLPPWTLERILLEAALAAFQGRDASIVLGGDTPADALFAATVDGGWVEMQTRGGVGAPPPASWLWDILLEVAQVRLHDGGIPQGEADVWLTLEDVPLGLRTDDIVDTIRENLQADPALLTDVARRLIDASEGDADFYYLRPGAGTPAALDGDWLVFISPEDIRRDDEDRPVRDWTYPEVGFFADSDLRRRVSDTVPLEGDLHRQKVRVEPGDRLYAPSASGGVFRIDVGEKPALHRITLEVTRVR